MAVNYSALLNDRQLEAVESPAQYVRIIAGAGSGKTRVLTYRIAYLIEQRHVDPGRILAIAFTNKVAQEMLGRAKKLVEDLGEMTNSLKIMTFHSLAARFLRIEAAAIGYPRGFTIYDEDDQSRLVKVIAEEKGYRKGDSIVKEALSYIRRKKGQGLYPQDIKGSKDLYERQKLLLSFYEAYEKKKGDMFALDFDDLLLQCLYILENDPEIRERWASRFDHILVDEFQDTNDVQFRLLKLLLTPLTSVYVVGDPDQTIYTWRGANQKLILDFEKSFGDVETVILNENYRSTKNILQAANQLIKHNQKRVPKDLFTNGATGEVVKTYNAPNSEREAEWVCREIKTLVAKSQRENGEPDYSDIAILYRSSYLTRPFEQAMARSGIPYRIFGGLRFYERMEVKDLLAYFSLLVNPKNNIAFERIVNVPRRGIGDTTLAKIREESGAHGLSEYEYLERYAEFAGDSKIPSKAVAALMAMVAKVEATKERLEKKEEAYPSILRDFVTSLDYMDYLKDDEEEDEDRVGNVNALLDDIMDYLKKNPESTFDEYLQNVTLLTSQDDMNNGNYVSLMTVHVAKGLEFDNVFVVCLNDGSFPSKRALEETERDGAEEERRLAYVAFTRAKKRLYLSCNRSYSYATDSHAVPSPYFKEAGLKVEEEGAFRGLYGFNKTYGGTGRSFFSDGGHIDPFTEKSQPVEEKKEAPKTNGIEAWHVGDIAHHETFGDGKVVELISKDIIVIDFDNGGRKTLMANHPRLSRLKSKGGDA